MRPSGRTLPRARRFAPVHLAPLGSIYDIQRAVAGKVTVPIYHEMGDGKLKLIAAELITPVKKSVTIESAAPRERPRQDQGGW